MLIMLAKISALEWVIIGLSIAVVIGYTIHAIYRKKHPKQKKVDDEDE